MHLAFVKTSIFGGILAWPCQYIPTWQNFCLKSHCRKTARYIWQILCQYTECNISFWMTLRTYLAEVIYNIWCSWKHGDLGLFVKDYVAHELTNSKSHCRKTARYNDVLQPFARVSLCIWHSSKHRYWDVFFCDLANTSPYNELLFKVTLQKNVSS